MARKALLKTSEPKFFEFMQNNSGGSFIVDEHAGIDTTVIIEATSADNANDRAIDIGLYFNGCDSGFDCPCCGDRWSPVWRNDGSEVPTIFGEPVTLTMSTEFRRSAYIHYLDGRIEKVIFND